MNRAKAVADLVGSKSKQFLHAQPGFGSKRRLAEVIGKDPAIVTRMIAKGEVPMRYHATLMKWAEENEVMVEMRSALFGSTCPCCLSRLD